MTMREARGELLYLLALCSAVSAHKKCSAHQKQSTASGSSSRSALENIYFSRVIIYERLTLCTEQSRAEEASTIKLPSGLLSMRVREQSLILRSLSQW